LRNFIDFIEAHIWRYIGDCIKIQDKILTKGWAKKLQPKYIGLYKVMEVYNQASTVKLELLATLEARHIKLTFHMSLIKLHVPNDNERFPHCDMLKHYDFSQEAKKDGMLMRYLFISGMDPYLNFK
jgi:hypothetical protein